MERAGRNQLLPASFRDRKWKYTREIMFEGLFQPMHLLIIAFIALLVFGPKKLPELGKGLGDGIKSFKQSIRGTEADAAEEKPSGESATM